MDEKTKDLAPLIRLTHIVYALQALGFLTLLSPIAGVVINNIKMDDVKGTWLESHFLWQVRTFLYTLLWVFVSFLLTLIVGIGMLGFFIAAVWFIYRIAKGWLRLNEGGAMYMDTEVKTKGKPPTTDTKTKPVEDKKPTETDKVD